MCFLTIYSHFPSQKNFTFSYTIKCLLDAGLGRIAGILSLETEGENLKSDALKKVGSELAMHVVASKPLFLSKELVSSDALENEREILKSQVWFDFINFCNRMLIMRQIM